MATTKKKYTWRNNRQSKGEVNEQPSMTQQGQTHTIKELIKRYAQGIPITTDRRLQWAEENDEFAFNFRDLTDLDLAQDQINRVKTKLAELKDQPPVEEQPIKPTNKNREEIAALKEQKNDETEEVQE